MTFLLGVYIVLHIPAILLLIIGRNQAKKRPTLSPTLIILGIVYFIIGTGICGNILMSI